MIIFLSIILTIFISANFFAIGYCLDDNGFESGWGIFLITELILIGIFCIWLVSYAISRGIVCSATNNDHKGCEVEIKTEESK